MALVPTPVVLPVLGFVSALDGQAWTSSVRCQVTEGTRTETNRLVKLSGKGNGVVGWYLDREEVSNGARCAAEERRYVREPG
ncbi:hypothetical protein ACFW5V_23995 [Streptomyces sp. NPDC058762]|uniref:hypothetical protein n=1 Tax=Streptomyces sp. NPDC058762 TaxID=3346629 RepID=UPI0036CA8F78